MIHRVLVTGAAGTIGREVCSALLARGHVVRGLDRGPTPFCTEQQLGDIRERAAVERAAEGMDTLFHLAACVDEADFLTQLVPHNIVGLYHVLEAARRRHFRRVVIASSLRMVNALVPFDHVVGVDAPPAPDDFYSATKVFAEALGKVYALRDKLSVVCARIGWLSRAREEAIDQARAEWSREQYTSHADMRRFAVCAVEAENVSYAVVWALSQRRRPAGPDLASGRVIGFQPQDVFPAGLPAEWYPIE
jgi:uronate dehydrogenase